MGTFIRKKGFQLDPNIPHKTRLSLPKEGRQRTLDPRGQTASAGQGGREFEVDKAAAYHPSTEI